MRVLHVWLSLFAFACLALVVTDAGEDFYKLLGVERDASARDIRKAFKKLALKMHPDKNTNDPEAHDKFLLVNRAYEVLKNEDDRKKYDEHGEDGLKEGGPTGRGYRSWNFYNQEFGIYDDDSEIITLGYSDFEQLVLNSEDLWFVNFYSPQCHHCHDLAPSWREVARELDGVVRIGAVNCGDDWGLCQQQGVHSYPSLFMYPQKEKYHGERTTAKLVKHVLKFVKSQVHALLDTNFKSKVSGKTPWVVTYCSGGSDCLEDNTAMKLAAMLNEMVNVGTIDCHYQEALCEKLGHDGGTYFYENGEVEKGKGVELPSLDANELATNVLGLLPDLKVLEESRFQTILSTLKSGSRKRALLVHFVESGDAQDVELRKLPALLDEISVGRVECSRQRTRCNEFHIQKLPMFIIFKVGGGHEVHHGRTQTAHDVAAFAKNTHHSPSRVLDDSDFPETVIDSGQPWFVDFFAPWCPPCMRLLPEFRKASKQMAGAVNFGTVDCTIHKNLCNKYGVHSYPTTIFYNQSKPHRFHGNHHARDLVEFVENTLHPTVVALTSENFDVLINNRGDDETWLVDFFAPWCGPCKQLAPEWQKVAKMFKTTPNVFVGSVDCDAEKSLCQANGVRSYPNIVLYPAPSRSKVQRYTYNNWMRNAGSIRAWAFAYLPSVAVELTAFNFGEKVSWSAEPWVVDFHAPWCGHCQVFAPEFENVAGMFKGRVNFGKVNCDQHKQLCRSVGIHGYPSVRYYAGSNDGNPQKMQGQDLDIQANVIIRFLNERLPKKDQVKEVETDNHAADDDNMEFDNHGGGEFMDMDEMPFEDFGNGFGGQDSFEGQDPFQGHHDPFQGQNPFDGDGFQGHNPFDDGQSFNEDYQGNDGYYQGGDYDDDYFMGQHDEL